MEMTELEIFTQLLTASLIIMVWSFLYRENVFYRIAEHLAIGSFFGYILYMSLKTLYDKTLVPLAATWAPDLVLVTIIGILMWTRLVPKLVWPSRISISVLAGISMAVAVTGAVSGQIIGQIRPMGSWAGQDLMTNVNNIISAVAAFTSLAFFTYTKEHKGVLRVVSRIGRTFIMVCFGAILGTFLMGNLAFSIGQIPSLVTGYGVYVSVAGIILIMADLILSKRKMERS